MGVSENRGTLFWGPYSKDPTIQGAILGSPIFGNSQVLRSPQRPFNGALWSLKVGSLGGLGSLPG